MVFRQALSLLAIASSLPAYAQRTTANAVTQADDAFGRAVGNDRIGIYSSEEVRGFNPVEAGNVRIEGLYYDQQGLASNRMVDSSSIRVGYGARGFPFPSPTGIVDLKLEKYEGKRIYSAELEMDTDGNSTGSLQLKVPLIKDKLGLSVGQGFRIARLPHVRYGNFNSQSLFLGWTPRADAEVTAYISRFKFARANQSPFIFPATPDIPARIPRKTLLGQPWARNSFHTINAGLISKIGFGEWRVDAGLFRSQRSDDRSFADLLLGARPDGSVANRLIVADEDNFAGSTSGEVRVTRRWIGETLRHSLIASVRGRDQKREFGGQQRVSLGASRIDIQDDRARPNFTFGANDVSAVKQITLGLGYELQIKNRGSLSIAAQKADYRKTVDFANAALANAITRDKPFLLNANASINLLPGLIAYGGYVRGLEESAVAPDIAINRSEAPPALRTRQVDAGLRYAITDKLALIAGVFDIKKPYFNVDSTQRFRQLGGVRNRGVELSLSGTLAKGLTIVAGALIIDPKISGPDVEAGLIGERPVGSFKRRAVANLDWRPAGQEAWSFDLALEAISPETANIANSFSGTARETVGIGTRYRFKLGRANMLLRGLVTNLFNDYGWRVSSSGGFSFSPARTISLSLAADI
jgi:iron complex outermembrane recepter protein